MIVLPFYTVNKMGNNPLMKDLYIHSLGFFPDAQYHYIDRPYGCPEYLLIYCTKGKGWFETNGGCTALNENQFVILEAQQPHKYGSDPTHPWSIYWIHFKGYKAEFFAEQYNCAISVLPDESSRINDRLKLFEEIYNALSDSFEPENLYYANLCLGHFLGTIRYVKIFRSSAKHKDYGNTVTKLATHYMTENIEKNLSLTDFATYFGFSPAYFCRIFKKNIGYAPMAYFTELKIQQACYYLQTTPFRINQIAGKLGFDDPYHFSRIFTHIMGMSPQSYRKQTSVH
ncbi:transcriptional regulator [Bacteroidia bacterium]|nr:transcriptional regulator [Bacteroidia bacterium]